MEAEAEIGAAVLLADIDEIGTIADVLDEPDAAAGVLVAVEDGGGATIREEKADAEVEA